MQRVHASLASLASLTGLTSLSVGTLLPLALRFFNLPETYG